MNVRVLKGFVGHYYQDGERKGIVAKEGDEFELPAEVDWLNAGLVEAVGAKSKPRSKPRRTAVRSTGEKAIQS